MNNKNNSDNLKYKKGKLKYDDYSLYERKQN